MAFIGRLEDVDLRLLRVFVAVVENGGISNAADSLGVDRSTISRQLSDIETRLQLRLCNRSRSGFLLTEEGRVILERTQELLGAVRAFNMHINDIHKELSGEFIIAITDGSSLYDGLNFPDSLRQFHEKAPNVNFSIRVLPPDEVEKSINNRTCSLGIMPLQSTITSLQFESLYKEDNALYALASHEIFALDHSITLADITDIKIALVQYETRMTRKIKNLRLKAGPVTNIAEGLLTLIQTGTYMGILPTFYGDIFAKKDMIRKVEIPETTYSVDVGIVTHLKDRKSSMIDLFAQILKQNIK